MGSHLAFACSAGICQWPTDRPLLQERMAVSTAHSRVPNLLVTHVASHPPERAECWICSILLSSTRQPRYDAFALALLLALVFVLAWASDDTTQVSSS